MNYTQLSTAIVDTTENRDTETFAPNIPVFVKAAERRIYQAVKLPFMRRNQTSSVTALSPYLTPPTDFLAAWELAVIDDSAYYYLVPKDVSFIREAYPLRTYTGRPKYFAVFDNNTLLLGPTPGQSYSVEMHYFAYPASIVDEGTTWLGDNFETALLYGALIEAAVFMKSDEDTLKGYTAQFTTSMKLLADYAAGQLQSGTYR